jgi:stage II sporulation protein M
MALLLQAEAFLLLFYQYRALWLIVLALVIVAALLVRLGVRVFNREHLLGRDLDYLDITAGLRTFWQAVRPVGGVRTLYRQEIPGLLRGIHPELALVVLVVGLGSILVGWWGVRQFPLPLDSLGSDVLRDVGAVDALVTESGLLPSFSTRAILWAILWNNARSLLISGLLGMISLGTLAVLLLMLPLVIVAYLGMQIGGLGVSPWLFLAVTVLPHAILELPAAIVATAQAMRIGDIILRPPADGGGVLGIVREAGRFVKLFLAVVLPLLLVAAWIEANVTPRLLVWFLGRF